MRIGLMLASALLILSGAVFASDTVGVPGSHTLFYKDVDANVGGKAVKLTLTGTALRTKLVFNVYAVGSYVQQGVAVKSAEELAAVDCAKRLHLVMERSVDAKDMAEAFRAGVRMNYPEPAYKDEVDQLVQYIRGQSPQKGAHVHLTHIPGVGLHCAVLGKGEVLIKNPRFSQAVWDIYLGKNNLGEAIKKGLTS